MRAEKDGKEMSNSKWHILADPHFSHGNIIKYCKRLAFCNEQEKNEIIRYHAIPDHIERRKAEKALRISKETIQRMDQGILDNTNKKVGYDDWLIINGDFCFGDEKDWENYRRIINCRYVILCLGNHDIDTVWENGYPEEKLLFDEKIFTKVFPHGKPMTFLIHGRKYVVGHYAMRVWDQSHRGSAMFYGHTHGALYDDPNILSFDVGVDCHDYTPLCIPDDTDKILAKKTRKKDWFEE